MASLVRRFGIPLLCSALFLLRDHQVHRDFEAQQSLFTDDPKGSFQLWVSEEPEVLFDHPPGSHDTGRLNGVYQPFVREIRAVCTLVSRDGQATAPVKVRCSFRLSHEVSQPILNYGDALEVEGKILKPPAAMNPGQFDYAHFLKTRGVPYVMYAAAGKWRKAPSGFNRHSESPEGGEESMFKTKILRSAQDDNPRYGWVFLRWSCWLKRKADDALYRSLPFPENALLDGLLLGERGPLPSEMVENFMATGTVHILAVSGLITAFIAGLFFMVFRVLQFKRKAAAGLALAGLVFFVFMTGAHPPVCRAGLFSGLALTAILLERKIRGGTLLLTTAIVLAFLNPFVLEDLSFQISFLATAGLMAFAGRVLDRLSFLWEPAAVLVTATLCAQLSVWCLLIYYFNQPSLYSVPANLLIVPLALMATAGGFTVIIGSFLHPFLGQVFGAACEVPLKTLVFLADKIASWPGAHWVVASPPAGWVLAFHSLLLIGLAVVWPRMKPEAPSENWKKREAFYGRAAKVFSLAVLLFLVGSSVWWGVSTLKPQPFRAVFLSVGHGNAVVLSSPQGRILVVDGGKGNRGADRHQTLVAYLRHEGVRSVEGVLNTHPDEDHVGGLVNLLSAYPVKNAYEGEQAQADTRAYRNFKNSIAVHRVAYSPLTEGRTVGDLVPVQVEILHPPARYQPRLHAANNLSVVSEVNYGGIHFILPGDLEKEGLQKLLAGHKPFPRVDWLMAPHHGRRSGEPALCAQEFKPRFVVLSDWRDYPDDHTFFQAARPEAVVLSTATEGAIEVEVQKDGSGRYRTFREGMWHPFKAEADGSLTGL